MRDPSLWERRPLDSLSLWERRPLDSLSLWERAGVRVFARRERLGSREPKGRRAPSPASGCAPHGRSFAICRHTTIIGSKPTTTMAIDAVEASASRSSDASM